MSRGSPIITVRIPHDLLAAVEAEMARAGNARHDGPWTRSEFICTALREKIAKMARSRVYRGKRKADAAPEWLGVDETIID